MGYLLLVTLCATILLVAYSSARRKPVGDLDSLIVADRRVGLGLISASVAASWIWTTTILGASEAGLTFGISGGFHYAWGAVVPFLVFVPVALRIRRRFGGVATFGEFIQKRYGLAVQRVFVAFGVGVAFYVYTEQLIGAGILFKVSFGIPYELVVVVTALTVVSYVTIGGLRSSLATDLLQFLVVAVAASVVIPWVVVAIGGPQRVLEGFSVAAASPSHPQHDPALDSWVSRSGIRYGLTAVVVALGQVLLDQGYYQRAIAAASSKTLRKGYLLGGVVAWFPIPLAFGLVVGGAGLGLSGDEQIDLGTTSDVAPEVMGALLGAPGVLLFTVMTFMAASSTADTSLAGVQALLAKSKWSRSSSRSGSLSGARFASVIFGGLGAAVALLAEDVSLLFYDIFSGIIFAAPVAALVCGVFSTSVKARTALVATFSGLAVGLFLWFFVQNEDVNWFYGNLASLLVPFLVIGIVSVPSWVAGSGGDE